MADLLARLKRLECLNDLYSSDENLFIMFARDVVELGGELSDEQLEVVGALHARSLRRVVQLACSCGGRLTDSMYCVQCGDFCTNADFVPVDLCVNCFKRPIGDVCSCTKTYRLEWLWGTEYV